MPRSCRHRFRHRARNCMVLKQIYLAAGSESLPLSLDSADDGTASLEALLKFEDELLSASLTALGSHSLRSRSGSIDLPVCTRTSEAVYSYWLVL